MECPKILVPPDHKRSWHRILKCGKIYGMKRKSFLIGIVALAVVLVWRFAGPSEERRVRKVFDRVSELLSKSGTEPVFAAAAKARDLAKLVAHDAHLEIPERNFNFTLGNNNLAQQIAMARSQTQFIKVTFEEISVVFADEDTALVTADVLFNGTSDLLGFSGRDTRELDAALKRESSSGDWLFSSVSLKPIVEK